MFKRYNKEIDKVKNEMELDRFLNEDYAKDDGDFDVLIWWKLNSHRLLILSNISHDLLAALITIVAF